MKIVLDCVATPQGLDGRAEHVMQKWAWLGQCFRQAGHEVVYVAGEHQPGERLEGAMYFRPDELALAFKRADWLFVWNGSLADQKRAVALAESMRLRVMRAELGWLPQHKTLYFDTRGTGPDSTLADWVPRRLLTDAEEAALKARLREYRRCLRQYISPSLPDVTLEPPFVLVPLQVEDDSQIVHFSKFDSMQPFIDRVASMRPNKRLVFKLHPRAGKGKSAYRWPEGCAVVSSGLAELLEKCDEVITINSTVGIEAMAHGKPVTALGRAFWSAWTRGRGSARLRAFLFELFRRQWLEDWLCESRALKLLHDDIYA